MSRTQKIVYWVSTLWLALGMMSTGVVQLMRNPDQNQLVVENLGYPVYLLTILGVWKVLGVIAVLVPRFPLLKEWAYAGFFFAMSGAVLSHIASGSPASDFFGPTLLIVLTVVSWYSRPADRKITALTVQPQLA